MQPHRFLSSSLTYTELDSLLCGDGNPYIIKIRTTRSGPATTEPTYKDVAKLIGYKQDKYENEYVKVICKGESTKMAFWASATQLVPKDENCNIKDILGSLKEKHNSRKFKRRYIIPHYK